LFRILIRPRFRGHLRVPADRCKQFVRHWHAKRGDVASLREVFLLEIDDTDLNGLNQRAFKMLWVSASVPGNETSVAGRMRLEGGLIA
jgi:hypothetical protein